MSIEGDENLEGENLEEDNENLEDENLEKEEEEEGEENGEEGNEEELEGEFDIENVKNLFDPNEYPKDLQPAFKKMQAIFTKKMQDNKDELSLAQLMKDNPEELISMLAKKTGMVVSKEEGKKEEVSETEKWIVDLIKKHSGGGDNDTRLTVAKMQSSQRLKELTDQHPDWAMYEDEMAKIVKEHPTLSTDLGTVYEMATKSVDKADEIIKAGGKKKKVSTKTKTHRKTKTSPTPKTARAALEAAMEKLGYT